VCSSTIKKDQEENPHMKMAFSCKENLNLQMDKSLNKSCPDLKNLEKQSHSDPTSKKLKKIMGG